MNRRAPARTRALLLLIAAALVLVQSLGSLHKLLHDPARVGRQAAVAAVHGETAHEADVPTSHQAAGTPWLKALFGGHHSAADCDDFDHMAQAEHTGFDLPSFEVQAAHTAVVACHRAWHLARQAAGFLARGPPLTLI